ncbi:MAG TPA: YtxH domain-containing protein [Ohtaekwangia sp.]|nr:YtxH domain-containing protein [Ohtaekwangia sp.]
MKTTPKILLGTLAGLAAGVVIGMLIAPEKGSTLRKNIIKKGDDLADAMEGKWNEVAGKLLKRKGTDVMSGRNQEVEV